MKKVSKNKVRKKELQILNTIEETKKMNSSLEISKNEYKEKTMDKNNQNKISYINKLNQILHMRQKNLKKDISRNDLKNNISTLYSSFKLKQTNKIEPYRSKLSFILNIIVISLLISITNEISIRKLISESTIVITFKESGNQMFLNKDFEPIPDYIWVNDQKENFEPPSDGKNHILLPEGEYTLKVGWKNPLTSCSNMFNGVNNIKSIDLSKFDTSKVSDMSYMFNECRSLQSLNLQNFKLTSVENLSSMFKSCIILQEIDLSNLDASHVTTMSGMFDGCSSIKNINLSNLKLGSLKDMSYLFNKCNFISEIDLLNFDTKTVQNMSHVFSECTALKSLDLSNFDTSSVQDMEEMFGNTCSLSSLDLSNFNTKSLISMKKMFYNCLNLIDLNTSSFDTSSVTDMTEVFHSCSALLSIDISNFRTTKYTSTNGLFQNCIKLKSLKLPSKIKLLSNNMMFMFQGCKSLTTLDLSQFDTSSVTNMEYMFNDCTELNYVNLSQIDTSSVEIMGYMFKDCPKLERIDLSKLDLSSLKNMNNMFYNCKSLLFLNLGNLKLDNIEIGSMLNEVSKENLTLCYEENYSTKFIENFGSLIKDCNNNCFKESTKLISELKKCVNDCKKDDNTYIYEFNDKCYENCPENTTKSNFICKTSLNCEYYFILDKSQCFESVPEGYYIYDNENKLIDECYKNCKTCNEKGTDDNHNCITCKEGYFYENGNCVEKCKYFSFTNNNDMEVCSCPSNIKCRECSNESSKNDLCISCNERDDYFTKYSEKDNKFINCYKSLKGYYLRMSYFHPCYETCDECSSEGYQNQHQCTACKSGYKFINEIGPSENCYKICEYFYYIDDSNEYQCTALNECPSNRNKLIEEKKKCVPNCRDDNTYQFEYNNKCYIECPDKENKIIENYICKNKTEDKTTEIITDKINKDENTQKPTFHIIQTTEMVEKEEITDKIVIPTDKKTEKSTTQITHTNSPTFHVIQTTEMVEKEVITDKIVIPTDKKTEKSTIHITPTTSPTSKISQNTEKVQNEGFTDIIVIPTDKKTEKPTTQTTPISNPTSEITQNNDDNWNAEDFFLGLLNEDNKEILNKDDIIKKIKEDIINHKIDSLLLNVTQGNKEDLSIKEGNVLYQITTTENQNNNTYNNISTIKLGKCEEILKTKYNISSNLSLIIFKIDYYIEGLLIPIIGYEVYEPINKSKLNLSYCEDSLINYNIPVTIDENNLFKYDPNSEYYNDECNAYTTENGTDIILNDRKEDFKEKNMSLCENLCDYMGYDKDTKKALCECGIRYKEFVLSEIDKQTDLLINNFTKDDTNSNLGTMKCYEVLFSKEGLLTNIGSYILLLIILIHTISTIIFYKCGYYFLENNVKSIIKKKKKLSLSKSTKKVVSELKNKTNISKKQKSEKIKLKVKNKNKDKKNKSKNKNKNKANPLKKIKSKKNLVINQVNININNNNNNSNSKSFSKLKLKETDIFSPQSKIRSNNNKMKKFNKDKKRKKANNILSLNKYNDFELNIMDYNDALCIDNRTYFQYYCSLLKTKHPIIFTFFSNRDYNSLIIKICLFSLSFAIYYSFNAIFFNYSIIHIIYKDGGSYNLSYLFPLIIYAFLISYYINVIIRFFSLSERNLLELKNQKTIKQMNSLVPSILRCLIIKYIFYFVLSIIFLTIFWYYISSFGAVFQNSQVYLIKNTFISFTLGLNYPFFIYLIPGIFRRLSLRAKNRKFMYTISNILQNL